jgi:hypothetical protein
LAEELVGLEIKDTDAANNNVLSDEELFVGSDHANRL